MICRSKMVRDETGATECAGVRRQDLSHFDPPCRKNALGPLRAEPILEGAPLGRCAAATLHGVSGTMEGAVMTLTPARRRTPTLVGVRGMIRGL